MNAVIIFVFTSVLLVAGKILRVQIPLLQRLYLPSSIVGGMLGLVLVSAFGSKFPAGVIDEMRSMPGFLINVIFGLAVLVGFGILQGCKAAEAALFPDAKMRLFVGFPMFPLCMLGGALLQRCATLVKIDLLVDRDQMMRIPGASLDYLAVSAVATIQLSVVAANWKPLAIMAAAGLAWTALAVVWFSPRLFREAWFERGIAEFGQATGVTATGLLLLRASSFCTSPR